jgi:ADP-heptose:LPS heptosyltransferase
MKQQNILVIKLSALGDFFIALGAMEAIRRSHPDARITLLTTKLFADMAGRSGYFDEVWAEPRPKFWQLREWLRLFAKLNCGRFRRVYDLQMNDRTRAYYGLFLIKPEWSGVISGSPLFYDNRHYKTLHAFKRHQEVLKVAGIDVGLPDISWMNSDISAIQPQKPYVLIIPGSAPQHPQKRWPAASYAALALKLTHEGYQVAALGTKAEADVIANIQKTCPALIDLSGKTTFYDIATLARHAAGAVGNDTGPTHIVSLAGCPVTVLFSGSSSPELSAPAGPSVDVIQSDDISKIDVEDVINHFRPRGMAA